MVSVGQTAPPKIAGLNDDSADRIAEVRGQYSEVPFLIHNVVGAMPTGIHALAAFRVGPGGGKGPAGLRLPLLPVVLLPVAPLLCPGIRTMG